jgi:DNA replication protein DnaC
MIETITSRCTSCHQTFEAGVFPSPSELVADMVQKVCDSCVEKYDQKLHNFIRPGQTVENQVSCVPAGYQDFDFDKLPEQTQKKAVDFIFPWRFSGRGVGLGGPSDNGKTYLIFEAARRQQESGKRVSVIKDQAISRMVRENSPERDKLIANVRSSDVVVWDDFGLSKMTDAVEGTYNDLLEICLSRNLPILGTCNYGGDQVKKKWSEQMRDSTFLDSRGERIVRRFRDQCEVRLLK